MSKLSNEAWGLDDEHMAVLAAIGSAKGARLSQISDAGLAVNDDMLQRLKNLELIKNPKSQNGEPIYNLTSEARSMLWRKSWPFSGYPLFAHHPVVRAALTLAEAFGDINTKFLARDVGVTEEDVEPYLARMERHNMIVRDGKASVLLDKTNWRVE